MQRRSIGWLSFVRVIRVCVVLCQITHFHTLFSTSYEKGHKISEEVRREIYMFNATGSRTTRANIDADIVPRRVHGTLCCTRCGTKRRDGEVGAVSIGLHLGSRQADGHFKPKFLCRGENQIRWNMSLAEVRDLVADQLSS